MDTTELVNWLNGVVSVPAWLGMLLVLLIVWLALRDR